MTVRRGAGAFLAFAVLCAAAEVGPVVPQTACQPGGFTLLQFSGGVVARPKPDGSFNVNLDNSAYQGNAFDAALRSAMSTWSSVGGSSWRYNFSGYTAALPSTGDGQMTVVSGGGRSFPSGVLATTMIRGAGDGTIYDSDIFFNPAYNLTTTGSGLDFESVALHEMGHGLGLDHNDGCYTTRTVMQSAIASDTQRRSLAPPEIEGLRYLYSGSGAAPPPAAPPPVVLTAAPSTLVFTGLAGGIVPPSQNITLSGAAGLTWTASPSVSWLQLAPSNGSVPGVVNVLALTADLPAGVHSGRIAILSAGLTREVTVALNLSAPNTLQLNPSVLSFSALAGGDAPGPQSLLVSGTAGLSFAASVITGGSWLRVSPASGTLPASTTISVIPAALTPQLYAGRITVTAAGITREVAVQFSVSAQPRLVMTPAQLSFSGPAGSTLPICSSLDLAAGSAAGDFTAAPAAPWLAVLPASGRLPATLSVCAAAGSLLAGAYDSALTITAFGVSQSFPVHLTVAAGVLVRNGGVGNAASFAVDQPITAGELLSIFGENLAAATASAAGFPLPTELGEARVLVGGLPARLLYVSPRQINLVTPAALADLTGSSTTLVVYNGRQTSPAVRIGVARQAPGVFTMLGNGAGAGAVTHSDGSLVTHSAPLTPGETVSVYLTGLGPLNPAFPDGLPAPSDPLPRATGPVRLVADGQDAEVLYAGAAPGFSGLQLVVATLPASLSRRFPEMSIEVGGAPSNRFSAGGPGLYDISPSEVRAGSEVAVTLRGINLAPSSALRIGNTVVRGALTEGSPQSLRVAVPARLLSTAGVLVVDVVDADALAELPSNYLLLTIQP